ncbi:acyltransferase [Novosphingobium umbonatum]|uniref:Acyltransferase n=1 Tax=Novosphingobium umbonatum TaxID=1908524 RepID=A0A3S2Y6Z7_9SPHN|nr:acyltransferase [Novosphingobium umbonatum]RVU03680.1 acyltransferase [Novosphingobium umbonatum]
MSLRYVKISESMSSWLDFFRCFCAFLVLLSHVSHRVVVHFRDLDPAAVNALMYIMYMPSSFGVGAVMIFFVLSGFLVGGSAFKKIQAGNFSWRDFVVARLARLWIVLIPSLLLTRLLPRITESLGIIDRAEIDSALDLFSFSCNVAFLQLVACDPYGNNGALWSLFNEFWYYIAWPILMMAFALCGFKKIIMPFFILVLALIVSFYQKDGANFLLYFFVWVFGVAAGVCKFPKILGGEKIALVIFVVAVVLWRLKVNGDSRNEFFGHNFYYDAFLGFSFANLMNRMAFSVNLVRPPAILPTRRFAEFSFSLYCTHTPVVEFICKLHRILSGRSLPFLVVNQLSIGIFLICVCVCVVFAYAFYWVTERHTARFCALLSGVVDFALKAASVSGIKFRRRLAGGQAWF